MSTPSNNENEDEFSLIRRFFSSQKVKRADVAKGIGDDCAILTPPPHTQLAISVDTLVTGVHFYPDMPPQDIGYKALACNLSDLAAAGAEPAWVTLALTLPRADSHWLHHFSEGFFSLAEQYQLALIGGDTTRGPLSITVQVHGFIPPQEALSRTGAQVGDEIYVTGTLGDAGFALSLLSKKQIHHPSYDYFLSRLYRPTPRIQAGIALRKQASACIDISDGLATDLSHILEASQVGACLYLDKLPLSPALAQETPYQAVHCALSAGDDYELCFTLPPAHAPEVTHALSALACPVTHIGTITEKKGLSILTKEGTPFALKKKGYNHFG
ncbi:MAG: thiamine-phosphate kinase [Gammaproteobacteria bacterium]|nr:thiamine-phosphate kinase [Gammaproteobacteria bacterium]